MSGSPCTGVGRVHTCVMRWPVQSSKFIDNMTCIVYNVIFHCSTPRDVPQIYVDNIQHFYIICQHLQGNKTLKTCKGNIYACDVFVNTILWLCPPFNWSVVFQWVILNPR